MTPLGFPRFAQRSPVVVAVRQRRHPGDRAGGGVSVTAAAVLGLRCACCRWRRTVLPVVLPAVVNVPVRGFGRPAVLPHAPARRLAVRLHRRVRNLAVRGM